MTERIPFLLLVHHRIIESQVINIYIINWLSYFIHTFIFPKRLILLSLLNCLVTYLCRYEYVLERGQWAILESKKGLRNGKAVYQY